MALGNPAQVGTNTSEAAQTSLATTATCVIPANSLVVVCVFNSNAAADPGDPTSVSDGTNQYTKDASALLASTNGRVTVWSFYDTVGRTATVTANFASSNMSWIYVFTVSGASPYGAVDKSGASSGFSAAMAVATLSAVAQSDEVSFGVYGRSTTDAPTTWPGAGYTSLVNVTDALRTRGFLVEYKNGLTSGSTETAPGTLATSSNLGRIVVTYRGFPPAALPASLPVVYQRANV